MEYCKMARVTVEDCVKRVPNRFDLVIAAAQRSREISNGIAIEVDRDNDKNPVVSLREIASEAIDAESLQERFIRSMQKNLIKENNVTEEERYYFPPIIADRVVVVAICNTRDFTTYLSDDYNTKIKRVTTTMTTTARTTTTTKTVD